MIKAFMVAVALSGFGSGAVAGPVAPWEFDMSPQQVEAVATSGPYRHFSNGDLETYDGVFEGHKENFQFFFSDQKLRRVGIYLYEGGDADAAGRRWLELRSILEKRFEAVRDMGNPVVPSHDAAGDALFVKEAIAVATRGGKTQMALVQDPAAAHVFASFIGVPQGPAARYLVIVYFDRPR